MKSRTALSAVRLFIGLLTLVAIGYQFVYLAQLGVLNGVNFFSYFTNLSNIFASIVFIAGVIFLLQRREPTPAQDLIRGASVVAMAIVFIVYGILLRHIDLGALQPWVNRHPLHLPSGRAGRAGRLALSAAEIHAQVRADGVMMTERGL